MYEKAPYNSNARWDAIPWRLYPSFSEQEFNHGGVAMHPLFLQKIQTARMIANTPFVITSGSRSKKRNQQVGGKPDSTHLFGVACDIAYGSSRQLFLIIRGLLLAGFTRIGVVMYGGKKFVHCDLGDQIEIPHPREPELIW